MSLRWGSSNSGNSQKKIKKVGPFVLTKTLGRGARGPTKLALHKERKEYAAIKIISKDEIVTKPMLLQKLEREIAILRVLRHPNIIRLFDCYESKNHL
jgi:serine/threonine protein kinase